MQHINDIISKYFDRDYFFAEESRKREDILENIERFKLRYPNILNEFTQIFTQKFPEWDLTDWSQLYLGDRCMRILAENKLNESRYIFFISVFELFAVYTMPLKNAGGRFVFGERVFINPGDNTFCDAVYEMCIKPQFTWLNSTLLNTVVEELSVRTEHHSILINYADALFTEHYNI